MSFFPGNNNVFNNNVSCLAIQLLRKNIFTNIIILFHLRECLGRQYAMAPAKYVYSRAFYFKPIKMPILHLRDDAV